MIGQVFKAVARENLMHHDLSVLIRIDVQQQFNEPRDSPCAGLDVAMRGDSAQQDSDNPARHRLPGMQEMIATGLQWP